jgi:hypothetical protein
MVERAEIFIIVDGLIDRWCARRAIPPLRLVLPVYPLGNPLTDGWHMLYDALRDVRRLSLPKDEMDKVVEAILILQAMLENR